MGRFTKRVNAISSSSVPSYKTSTPSEESLNPMKSICTLGRTGVFAFAGSLWGMRLGTKSYWILNLFSQRFQTMFNTDADQASATPEEMLWLKAIPSHTEGSSLIRVHILTDSRTPGTVRKELQGSKQIPLSYEVYFRWTPHAVIVTTGIIVIILGSSYIPTIPLLQGGVSS